MTIFSVALFRMSHSSNYYIKEIDGIQVDEQVIVTLEMLTELEKNGGWLKLPSAVSPYIMIDYHIETRYLIRDAVISWRVTAFDYFF